MTGAATLSEREAELVRRFGARIEAVRGDIADRNQAISGLYKEAKAEGLQPGLLRLALADRRRDRKLDDNEQARLDAYRRALDRMSEPRAVRRPLRGYQYIAGEPTGEDDCKCGGLIRAGSSYCEEHDDACHAVLGGNAA